MNKEILSLYTKYYDGNCSPEELEKVMQILGTATYEPEWNAMLREQADQFMYSEQQLSMTSAEMDALNDRIQKSLQNSAGKVIKITRPKRNWLWIAASAVLILGLAGISYQIWDRKINDALTASANKIMPGKQGATLTLADGKRIILNDVQNGKLTEQAGISITKTAEGKLVYEVKAADDALDALNTLSTTRGQTYQVRLPDGSLVWLNSASSLTYTAALLQQGKRKVKLSGEGYFEVAKDKNHPFVVESNGQEVEVLGTHFNINSYTEEGKTATTLQQGSVRISVIGGKNTTSILKPGQQALLSSGSIQISTADLETALAWKDGRLEFRDADLPSIMRTISRWYDIDVAYEGKLSDRHFEGSVSRQASLSSLLELLKLSNVKFNIKEQPSGKKLLVLSDN